MFSKVFAPIPLAVIVLLSAGPLSIASIGATAITSHVAVAGPSKAAPVKGMLHKFALQTGMADGKMVFIDAKGQVNPVLRAQVGDTIELTLASGEGAEHDIAIPELNVQSSRFSAGSGAATVRFTLTQPGTFTYYCSIPGHRQIGMEGVLEVTGPAEASAAALKAPNTAVLGAAASAAIKPISAAAPDALSIAMDPTAVPKPIGQRPPQVVKYSIETVELAGKLDDGTTFTYWTFAKKVPGPMLRVKKGDTIELTLRNARNSKMIHSIDLHAVTGGHGGGEHTQVAPGEAKTVRFKAMNAGLYVYHCATPSVAHHISAGMYGLILVEPEAGLPKVDREFYVMQGDLYTTHKKGTKGHQEFDDQRADDELPTYYTFNGSVGSLTKEFKMQAKVGETVRVYFGVGGPNKSSSFHAIGEIFDKVYSEGSISSVRRDVQTTMVPPGGATIVEFKVDYPGKYLLVDHALSRAGKGVGGTLEVTGPADGSIYQPLATGSHADH